jgi:anti-sigma factor RsiW
MTLTIETDLCDSEAARLLPWYVTGRIDAADAARVDAHIATCLICRTDLATQRELRALTQAEERVEYSPQPSLQKLMSRIDELDREIAEPSPPASVPESPPPARANVPRWLVAAVVLQTVGLALLGSLLWPRAGIRNDSAPYVTLGSVEAVVNAAPRLRVVFAPDMTVSSIARLLGAVRADIVAGPTESGAYTLALRADSSLPASVDTSLAQLRADPRVLFAEPVIGGTGPPR